MPPCRFLAVVAILALPALAAHAEWQGVPRPAPLPPQPLPQSQPQQHAKSAMLAASACYAGPISCTLMLPLRPGQPCHCRGLSGPYWGTAR